MSRNRATSEALGRAAGAPPLRAVSQRTSAASARALGWAQLQCLVKRDFDAVAARYEIFAEVIIIRL